MASAEASLLAYASAGTSAFHIIGLYVFGDIVLGALLLYFLPELSRHDIFFAVTVARGYRVADEAKRTLRQFRSAMWVHTAIGLAIVLAGFGTHHFLIPLLGIVWQIGGTTLAFLRARKQVLPHALAAGPQREAALTRRSTGTFYWLLQFGPFAILGAHTAYLGAHWKEIPARFPIHWGLNGEPNGWATRSFAGVFGLLLIAFITCIFIAVFSYGVVHWTRHIRASGPGAAAEARFRRVQLGALLGVQYFLALLLGGFSFRVPQAHPEHGPNIGPVLVLSFVFVIALYAVLIHTGQGGANLMKAGNGSDILGGKSVTGDRTPDECWRAGMFYVNPNDPALLVEKRFGIGYTLNFGRPGAWWLVAAMLALVIVPLVIAFASVWPH